MPLRPITEVPELVAIVQSDTTVLDPPLAGLLVFTAGAVKILTEAGATLTLTFPTAANGGSYPTRLDAAITKVFDTDTAVTDANLFGFR